MKHSKENRERERSCRRNRGEGYCVCVHLHLHMCWHMQLLVMQLAIYDGNEPCWYNRDSFVWCMGWEERSCMEPSMGPGLAQEVISSFSLMRMRPVIDGWCNFETDPEMESGNTANTTENGGKEEENERSKRRRIEEEWKDFEWNKQSYTARHNPPPQLRVEREKIWKNNKVIRHTTLGGIKI